MSNYFFAGLVLSMSDEEKQDCEKQVMKLKGTYEEKRKAFFELCSFNGTKQKEFWDKPITKLIDLINSYEEALKKAKQYLEDRKFYQQSTANAKLIVEFFQFRIRQYNELLEEIETQVKALSLRKSKKERPPVTKAAEDVEEFYINDDL